MRLQFLLRYYFYLSFPHFVFLYASVRVLWGHLCYVWWFYRSSTHTNHYCRDKLLFKSINCSFLDQRYGINASSFSNPAPFSHSLKSLMRFFPCQDPWKGRAWSSDCRFPLHFPKHHSWVQYSTGKVERFQSSLVSLFHDSSILVHIALFQLEFCYIFRWSCSLMWWYLYQRSKQVDPGHAWNDPTWIHVWLHPALCLHGRIYLLSGDGTRTVVYSIELVQSET